jgi:hypothetical protein
VICRVDRSTHALRRPHRPILLKGGRSLDRGLIGTSRLIDIVCTSVARDGAFFCCSRRRVVGAVRFHDVVLDERGSRPAIYGQVRHPARSERPRVRDAPCGSGSPSLPNYDVALAAGPADAVFTRRVIGV